MNDRIASRRPSRSRAPLNLSRRGLLGAAGIGTLLLGFGLPTVAARPGEGPGRCSKHATAVAAYLEIRAGRHDPAAEPLRRGRPGHQHRLAQIIGEELDVDPARFVVECAPAGPDYLSVNGRSA